MSAEKIISSWKKKSFKPVYWLEGEESFFIDEIVAFAEHHILSESEASFNLSVFYGKDADWSNIVNACMRYPMFSEKQVVLIKEAQHFRDIDKLESYIEKPLASTIFIIAYKEKKLDGRSKLSKLVKKQEYFSSEKIKEYKLAEYALQIVEDQGFYISQKALLLLTDHIGNDLSRLHNEIKKLALNIKQGQNITEDDIETYIGISKEFNVFELQDALAKKNTAKALRIIKYFGDNPKAAPIQLILPSLYGFFSKVAGLYDAAGINEKELAAMLGINPYIIKNYTLVTQIYNYNEIENILLLLHQYNLRSIGINDTGTPPQELLKEMVMKIVA